MVLLVESITIVSQATEESTTVWRANQHSRNFDEVKASLGC